MNDNFTPIYIIPPGKSKQIKLLKDRLKTADALYLATDEDREGEAISWHLLEILKPKVPVHRLVFHEITKDAIQEALKSPRSVDDGLVRAQETRRILDRLYGYEVSPLLWRKVRPKLSAGRVQSVAVRMIVERERERMAFVSATWWDLIGQFAKANGQKLEAELVTVDGRRIPAGKDFDPATGKLKNNELMLLDGPAAEALAERIRSGPVPRDECRRQAVHVEAVSAVHHQHAAAGGQPQARLHGPADDAGRPEPVRERPHHLHAYRFDEPGAGGDRRRPPAGGRGIWRRVSAGRGPRLQVEGQERSGGARRHSAGRPSVRAARRCCAMS